MTMHRTRTLLTMVALVSFILVNCADTKPKLRPGARVPEFSLKDGTGASFSLTREREDKLVVIIFMSTHCPASNGYNRRMAELHRDYAQKGVTILGVNSNAAEAAEEVLEHAGKHDIQFPVLKDPGNSVADAYGAQVTPEAFVIDRAGVLRYHGRIDDDMRGADISSHDLRLALDALLAGKAVSIAETRVFGCSIERVKVKES